MNLFSDIEGEKLSSMILPYFVIGGSDGTLIIKPLIKQRHFVLGVIAQFCYFDVAYGPYFLSIGFFAPIPFFAFIIYFGIKGYKVKSVI